MKVYAYPADPYGCGHYRIIWPARELARRGHSVVVRMPNERHELRGAVEDGRLVDVQVPPDADVIVMQRVTHRYLVDAIRLIRERYGIAVVVDVDDDLSRIHPSNAAFAAMHPKNTYDENHTWQHTVAACEVATLVQVSTPALLRRYARHGRGRVLRNCVPASFLDVPHEDSDVVGWAGAIHSHPDDLHVMGPTIARLVREGHTFRLVGPLQNAREVLGLDADPEATGVIDITEWGAAVAANIGVGVAPLTDTQFNAAKSALKPLEYAAAGVPCVMSPRAEYLKLHREGVGLVAEKPRDWYRKIKQLATDAGFRRELSARGREVVRDAWTIEGNAHRWWETWELARDLQERETPGLRDSLRPVGYAMRPLDDVSDR